MKSNRRNAFDLAIHLSHRCQKITFRIKSASDLNVNCDAKISQWRGVKKSGIINFFSTIIQSLKACKYCSEQVSWYKWSRNVDFTDTGMFPVIDCSCHVVAYRRAQTDDCILHELFIRNVIWYLFDQLNSIESMGPWIIQRNHRMIVSITFYVINKSLISNLITTHRTQWLLNSQ